ncbi:MAG: hypothetical protein JNN15_15135, partial [Blastocatellia bacterium]|nr:hypothetical protein [Blastocatellia bacterium]
MSVNNVSNSSRAFEVSNVNDQNQVQNTQAATVQQTAPQTTETVRREDTSSIGANFAKMQIQTALRTSGGTTPTLNASLQPQRAFSQQSINLLTNTQNLPANTFRTTSLMVNSANALQTSEITFRNGGTATSFYTAGFPPTSTATLPRIAFSPQGVLSFYKSAGRYNQAQTQSVQNLYAGDLTSRKNYSVNLLNIAKNLTSIRSSGSLDANSRRAVDSAISSLRSAYNSLSDPKAPAASPRDIYAKVASAYSTLQQGSLNNSQRSQVSTGLNLLAIGASNYDTNRVPVAGTAGTPAPAAPTQQQITAAGF